MAALLTLLYFAVLAFFVLLIGRLVLEWVQVFARDWRPRGPALVVAETVYTVTDPPLKGLRRVIRPIRIGSIQLDLAFLVLAFGCTILMSVLQTLASRFASA